MADSKKLSLKLLIDKKGQRVLFAEAGKDFIDFLFSLLALPVGSVIKLLEKQDMVGGLSKLYKSVSDLNNDFIQSNQNKDVLLNPKSSLPYFSKIPLLSAQAPSSPSHTTYAAPSLYRCGYCSNFLLASFCTTPCPTCKRRMTIHDDRYVLKSSVLNDQHPTKGEGFVKGLVTYMVMDDLAVSPLSTISNITLLNKFDIKDLGSLEEKVVHIGMNEGLELLKHSLSSKTVLTDVFLGSVVVKNMDTRKRRKSGGK